MIANTIQPSFSGGEFSPALRSRVDLQKYFTGLNLCRNFIIHPTGGMSNRPGTKFVAKAKYNDKKSRLVSFEFSITQAYILEFGHNYIRFFREKSQILKAGIPYEVTTTYTEAEIFELKFVQSADVLYIVHPNHRPMQLERYDHDDWELNEYEFENGPFRVSNISETNKLSVSAVSGTSKTMTAVEDTFFSTHIGSIWRLEHEIQGQAINQAFTATGTSSSIKCGGTWRIVTHGTWTATFRIEKSTDGGSTWKTLRTYSGSNDFNVNTFGDEGADAPVLIRINVTSYTSGTLNVDLTTDPFTQTGIVLVKAYTSAKVVTVDILKELGETTQTTEWAEGAWSDYRGWPSSVTFYQDRLVFASNEAEPQTIWMSVSGNYTDFVRSFPLEDTDGITINLPSRKMNGIRNLVGLSDLLALTSASEWTINGGQNALTPTTVQSKVEGYRGCSETVEPIVIGNRIIYVQRTASTVRDLGYDFGVNGFTGDILNIYSNHLLEGHTIIDMDYQEEPDNLVWFIRDDGIALSLTYLREQEVLAWAWHDTKGLFKSVSVIPADGYNEVWFTVLRDGVMFVEVMELRSTSTDPRQQYFLDCGLSYNSPKTITAITKAAQAVFTSTAHGFNNGDVVDVFNCVGLNSDGNQVLMSGINEIRFTISDKTANDFKLKNYVTGAYLDTSAMETYFSGGQVFLCTQTVTGYDHLEGKTVTVLADGSTLLPKIVSGGDIALDYLSSVVHAGYSYLSEFETLSVELQTKGDGTIQGKYVTIPMVTLRMENSRGGLIGMDKDHLFELIQRTDEPLGSPTRLYTQDYKISLDSTHKEGGRIFYRQQDPLPIKILAVVPTISVGGK